MNLVTWRRTSEKRLVTEQLLLEMKGVSARHSTKLVVVLLSAFDKGSYARFFQQYGLAFVDCAFEMPDDMRVCGEGHPNGKMSTRWAECISQALAGTL